MRKFVKMCLIAGGVCMLVGGGISITASMLGGTIWNTGFKKILGWEKFIPESTLGSFDEENFKRKTPGEWNESQLIYSSGEIKNLMIEAETGTFFIAEDPDATQVKVFCNKAGAYDMEEVEEELNLQSYWEKNGDQNLIFAIYLPTDYRFQTVDLELEPADWNGFKLVQNQSITGPRLIADVLSADELDLEASLSEVKIKNGNVGSLSIDNEIGGVEFSGATTGNIKAKCDIGEIKLELAGEKEDYNYDYQCEVGAIRIENENMAALSDEDWLDHGAGKEMNLECEIGNIEVDFANDEL